MPRKRKKMIVFLADFAAQSIREVCLGAAEFFASCPDVNFEPWSLVRKDYSPQPTPKDFGVVDGLLCSEIAAKHVFGHEGHIPVPCVYVLAHSSQKIPFVCIHDYAVGEWAAEHLIHRGYKNLLTIGSSTFPWSQVRAKGFERVCKKHRLPVLHYGLPSNILPVYWASNFSKRHKKLIQILQTLPKPCGIFATNDVISYFVTKAAEFSGLRVPSDVGIIGVDNDPISNAASGLAISSIQPPFREIGKLAASNLYKLIEGKRILHGIELDPVKVVVRTSTNQFIVQNKLVSQAQKYIESQCSQPLQASDVQKFLHTSAVTLNKHFQQYLHVTPAKYILSRRMKYAEELLRDGMLNVQQVSESCGFYSCSYFCKTFRQLTGQTPNSIRRKFKYPTHNIRKDA